MRLWLHLFHTAPTPPLLRDTGTPIFSGATSISPSHPYFSSLCSYPIQRRLFISSSSQVKTASQPASQPKRQAAMEDVPLGFLLVHGKRRSKLQAPFLRPMTRYFLSATVRLLRRLATGSPTFQPSKISLPGGEKTERATLQTQANLARQHNACTSQTGSSENLEQ